MSRQRFGPKVNSPSRNIKATALRASAMQDHRPPSGKHSRGRVVRPWQGTTRVADAGSKRRANKRTWQLDLVAARKRTSQS